MKISIRLLTLLLLPHLILVGCNYHLDKVGAAKDSQLGIPNDPSQFDYAMMDMHIFKPKCLTCHSTSTGNKDPNLESYAAVMANISDIQDDVSSGRMPFHKAPLSAQEKDMLAKWIANGAPETVSAKPQPMPEPTPTPTPAPEPTPTPTPSPTPIPTEPEVLDYATVNKNVIQPSCIKCHSGEKPKGDVSLETYQRIVSFIGDVQADIQQDKMPKRSKLTSAQKSLILDWIKAGAPETLQSPPIPIPPPTPKPTPTPPPAPTPTEPEVLDYATVNKNVIQPSCIKCHSGEKPKGDVSLESYIDITFNIGDIKNDIEKGDMPKRGTLTPEQKALILDWIKAGAPETAAPAAAEKSVRRCDEKKMTQAFVKFVTGDQRNDNNGASQEDECAKVGK